MFVPSRLLWKLRSPRSPSQDLYKYVYFIMMKKAVETTLWEHLTSTSQSKRLVNMTDQPHQTHSSGFRPVFFWMRFFGSSFVPKNQKNPKSPSYTASIRTDPFGIPLNHPLAEPFNFKVVFLGHRSIPAHIMFFFESVLHIHSSDIFSTWVVVASSIFARLYNLDITDQELHAVGSPMFARFFNTKTSTPFTTKLQER